MSKDFSTMENSNPSANPTIHSVSDPARRHWLHGGLAAAAASLFAPLAGCAIDGNGKATSARGTTGKAEAATAPSATGASSATGARGQSLLGFKPIAASTADELIVPEGYVAQVIAPWGEPVGSLDGMPAWRADGSNSAADQALQMGMHHDGIHYFPQGGANNSQRGLLVMNHEYTDDGLLHPDGMKTWTKEKVLKSQNAHGIAVIEVELQGGQWRMVRPSRFARRITPHTPFALRGPAAGHALMKTAADPEGRIVLGTVNNCASGKTPWGTYLSGEENFRYYFAGGDKIGADQKRWGMVKTSYSRWAEHDPRFDASVNPNEFHRFGWVVEVDPMNPQALPVKRTALGRAAHEGAWVATTEDGRAVVYSGEDARFEYIYKFVSRDKIAPASAGRSMAEANRELLDHGTLHVARFDADGTGRWLPLVHGQGPLTAANGFADQGEVVIKTRQASDLLGATKMDRPEWLAIDQQRREVFCTLTNNSERGKPGKPGTDAANPRDDNVMGQIIRWTEAGDFDATTMRWSHLVLAGDPVNARPEARGNINGDLFAAPDGLMFDSRGVLWIQTDLAAKEMNKGEFANIGNNQMLACDPATATAEIRRFLTGPVNCEITGATQTPDGRTMFINVQHPGETPSDRSDPAEPTKYSNWPDRGARPRSATVAIRRKDGGLIGT